MNESGAFFLPKEFGRWYYINDTWHYLVYEGNKTYFYRFEREKNCVIKLKRPDYLSARWVPNKVPVRGRVKGDIIVFSDGKITHKIPLKAIGPYLWSPQEASYLEAIIWKSGALIYPAYGKDLIPVKGGGYLLWEYYGNERFLEEHYSNSEVERLIKPEYVFIYDGKYIRVVPIVAFRYNPNITTWNGTFIWKLVLRKKFSPKECPNIIINSGNKSEGICGIGLLLFLSLIPSIVQKAK